MKLFKLERGAPTSASCHPGYHPGRLPPDPYQHVRFEIPCWFKDLAGARVVTSDLKRLSRDPSEAFGVGGVFQETE